MTDPGAHRPTSPARLWNLDVSRETHDGVRVVTFVGRIGISAAPRMAAILAEELRGENARILVVLDRVDYISSAGLLALQEANTVARERRVVMALSGLSEPVRLALDLAGVTSEFTLEG